MQSNIAEFKAELLRKAEVAKILAMGPRTVDRAWREGLMPAPRVIGGSLRWSRREVMEWINQGCPRTNKEDMQ
ncbi:MAG: helix-turn-helix transcriptional regulator [Planctomycetota bacterium]